MEKDIDQIPGFPLQNDGLYHHNYEVVAPTDVILPPMITDGGDSDQCQHY